MKVIYNKKFSGNAVIAGLAKSGKTTLVGAITREILEQGKDVLWINSDLVYEYLIDKVFGKDNPASLPGKLFMMNLKPGTAITEILNYLQNYIEQEGKNTSTIVVDFISFGSLPKNAVAYQAFSSWCKGHNISVLCTYQLPRQSITILYEADCEFTIDSENGNLEYKGFKFFNGKHIYNTENLFVNESGYKIYDIIHHYSPRDYDCVAVLEKMGLGYWWDGGGGAGWSWNVENVFKVDKKELAHLLREYVLSEHPDTYYKHTRDLIEAIEELENK